MRKLALVILVSGITHLLLDTVIIPSMRIYKILAVIFLKHGG